MFFLYHYKFEFIHLHFTMVFSLFRKPVTVNVSYDETEKIKQFEHAILTETIADYLINNFTYQQLKNFCHEVDIPTSGNKHMLAERLETYIISSPLYKKKTNWYRLLTIIFALVTVYFTVSKSPEVNPKSPTLSGVYKVLRDDLQITKYTGSSGIGFLFLTMMTIWHEQEHGRKKRKFKKKDRQVRTQKLRNVIVKSMQAQKNHRPFVLNNTKLGYLKKAFGIY